MATTTNIETAAWAQAAILDEIDDAIRTHPGSWAWTDEQVAAVAAQRNIVAVLFSLPVAA